MQRMILCATWIVGAVRYLTCRTFLFKYYNFEKKLQMIMFYFIALELKYMIHGLFILEFIMHILPLFFSKEEG